MTHTPGPWASTTDCAADMAHHPHCVRDAAGWSLAYVSGFTKMTAEANARLISAAPDMLAALEQAVADSDMPAVHGNAADCLFPWRIAARAAITKARGE